MSRGDAAPFIAGEMLHVDGGQVSATESPIELRPVGEGDFAAWLPLWEGYQRFYRIEIAEEVTRRTWERFLSPAEPMYALLAMMGNQALGLAHTVHHRSTWTTKDHCYLQDLFVAGEARGQSVGRALVERVYADAARRGAARVYWVTHESNHDAIRLYDRVAHRLPLIHFRLEIVN